ncbi:hypothetical protein E1301_Tti015447 [Triplophysa tibetana]|uniref:Myb/SANT-like DNA-binding domain-containing protein n=1 Tax=Triplophysa tibetana TaxID=1572043 RepID=A0A5A9PBC8_9TELE|nr:hypothetical protein E1301_Tti015447 [Triplophysa tibetana]
MDKGQSSKNFSEFEKTLFKQIVSNYPVIENKQHDSGTENEKKKAWISILNEFNSNEKVTKRTLQQVQYTLSCKGPVEKHKNKPEKTTAATRQERLKTGGGLPVPPGTEELGDLLAGINESQQPLEGIPDDDHLDSLDDLILTQDLGGAGNSQDAQMNRAAASTNMQQHPVSCSSNSPHPAVSNPGSRSRGKRMTLHEKLAIEFHEPVKKNTHRQGTGGGSPKADLTPAEDMALELNKGRPVLEGIPGGKETSIGSSQDATRFIQVSGSTVFLLEPPAKAPDDADPSSQAIRKLYGNHLRRQIELADIDIQYKRKQMENLALESEIKKRTIRKLDLEIKKLEREAIKIRFDAVLDSLEGLLAAATCPKFKLQWLRDECRREHLKELLTTECRKAAPAADNANVSQLAASPAEMDFFDFENQPTESFSAEKEVTDYLRFPTSSFQPSERCT